MAVGGGNLSAGRIHTAYVADDIPRDMNPVVFIINKKQKLTSRLQK